LYHSSYQLFLQNQQMALIDFIALSILMHHPFLVLSAPVCWS
jgi:hypothetical protein